MATGEEVTWSAVLLLPAVRGSRPFRIRIEEAELYVGPGGTLAPVYVPRVTYIETLQICAAGRRAARQRRRGGAPVSFRP